MANAKIINYGQQISAGSTAIPDNVEVALDIETTAGEDWILIDTETGAENMVLAGGNYPVMIGMDQRGPRMRDGHGSTSSVGHPVYTFRGDTDTGMTHLGTSNDDALALIAGGQEGIRITESGDATTTQINGLTTVKIADTNVTADTSCDDLVIEGTGSTGASVVTPNNVSGCVAFRSENTGGSDKSSLMVQGLYNSSNKALGKFRLMSGSTADDYLEFETNGSQRLKIDGTGSAIFNSDVSTIGKLTTALTDNGGTASVSTSGTSTTLTGVNTAFETDFHVGAAIKVGTVTTTVTTINSNTELILEDAINTSSTGTTCTRDGGELFAVKTGDGQTMLAVNGSGAMTLGTKPGTSTSNIAIGDADALDTITSGTSNIVIGGASDNHKLTSGIRNILVGHEAGEDISTGQWNVCVGHQAGSAISGGQGNVCLGHGTGNGSGSNYGVAIGISSVSAGHRENLIGASIASYGAYTTSIGNDEQNFIVNEGVGTCSIGALDRPFGAIMLGARKIISVEQSLGVINTTDTGAIEQLEAFGSVSAVKIPAYSVITFCSLTMTDPSGASTHNAMVATSTTSGTAAGTALQGTVVEIIGAGASGTRSTDTTGSASDIDLKAAAGKSWFNDGKFHVGSADVYVYVATAGTGNSGTAGDTKAILTIEYIGVD
jgi:hypothetical protein